MEFERVEVGADHHVEVLLSLAKSHWYSIYCLVAIIWGKDFQEILS